MPQNRPSVPVQRFNQNNQPKQPGTSLQFSQPRGTNSNAYQVTGPSRGTQSNVHGQIRTNALMVRSNCSNSGSARQPQATTRSGPSGAAAYPDLMPPGGFRDGRQRGMPTTGRGAASNINSLRNSGDRSNPYNRSQPNRNQGNRPDTVYSNRNRQTFSNKNATNGTSNNTGVGRNLSEDRPPFNTNQSVIYNGAENHNYDQSNWLGPGPPYNYMFHVGSSGHSSGARYCSSYPTSHQQCSETWPVGYQPDVGTSGLPPVPYPNMYPRDWTPAPPPWYPVPGHKPVVGVVQAETKEAEWEDNLPMPPTPTKRPTRPVSKPASGTPERGLQLVTTDIAGLRRWGEYKDKLQLMFEIYGYLDSAVTRAGSDCKEFLLRDDHQDTVSCVFYEIDRNLSKMVRGQWQRVVGTFDRRNGRLRCVSVRGVRDGERQLVPDLIQVSTATVSRLVQKTREP